MAGRGTFHDSCVRASDGAQKVSRVGRGRCDRVVPYCEGRLASKSTVLKLRALL